MKFIIFFMLAAATCSSAYFSSVPSIKTAEPKPPVFKDETTDKMKEIDACYQFTDGSSDRYLCMRKTLDSVKSAVRNTEMCDIKAQVPPIVRTKK